MNHIFLCPFTSCVVDIWVCSHLLDIKSNAALNILMQLFKGKYKDVNGAYKRAEALPFGDDFYSKSYFFLLSYLTLYKSQDLVMMMSL